MTLDELGMAIRQAVAGGVPNCGVMVKDQDTKKMYSVKGIELETNEDADGSNTLWIQVEEY